MSALPQARSDCVHEQVTKWIANVRFTAGREARPCQQSCRDGLRISALTGKDTNRKGCKMGMEKITSTANPQVRQLIQLQKKARLRKEEDVFTVEGIKMYQGVRRPIKIGRQNPQVYEVTDGLASGEKVIISGYELFGDNEKLILNE